MKFVSIVAMNSVLLLFQLALFTKNKYLLVKSSTIYISRHKSFNPVLQLIAIYKLNSKSASNETNNSLCKLMAWY